MMSEEGAQEDAVAAEAAVEAVEEAAAEAAAACLVHAGAILIWMSLQVPTCFMREATASSKVGQPEAAKPAPREEPAGTAASTRTVVRACAYLCVAVVGGGGEDKSMSRGHAGAGWTHSSCARPSAAS